MRKPSPEIVASFGAISSLGVLFIVYSLSRFGIVGWGISAIVTVAVGAAVTMVGIRWYYMSIIDDGTGIYNRRFLFSRLATVIDATKRKSDALSLIVIDVDDFRKYNSQYGHLVGDTVLMAIAGIMRAGIRRGDVVGRWGGEEFAIILPATTSSEALVVADRIREMISALTIEIDAITHIKATISAGIASFPQDGQTLRDLVNCADQAMYSAKQQKNLVLPFIASTIV